VPQRHLRILIVAGGVLFAVSFGMALLTYQEKLDPQAFLEAVGWSSKPGSHLIFPDTGSSNPLLPRSAPGRRVGLANMLRSDRFETAVLMIPGGQDPEAVPVVFIHGLMSTPDMWDRVVRELQKDRELAANFQFWFFYYPTGQPIPVSSLQLRETLDEAEREGLVRRPAVLVGHSMGGILARAQAVSLKPAEAEVLLPGVASMPGDRLARRALIFPAREKLARMVFIASPHRGTDFAVRGISRLGHRLIRLPDWLEKEVRPFYDSLPLRAGRRLPTSITGLLPGSEFLRAIDEAPSRTPAHSIIPLLGDPADPGANDGVVPLWSSRIPGAASELILPGDHAAVAAPETLRELRRILRLHAGLDAASDG
jgi:pimeloyl-ACP methyl ester carboxylesterase